VTIFYCLRIETSLFVASYDSQGHGGGIRPTGQAPPVLAITSRHEPHSIHCSSIVAIVSVAAGTFLPSHCLETASARTTENTVILLRVFFRRYLATASVYRVTA
jgi:hypothetical protein